MRVGEGEADRVKSLKTEKRNLNYLLGDIFKSEKAFLKIEVRTRIHQLGLNSYYTGFLIMKVTIH